MKYITLPLDEYRRMEARLKKLEDFRVSNTVRIGHDLACVDKGVLDDLVKQNNYWVDSRTATLAYRINLCRRSIIQYNSLPWYRRLLIKLIEPDGV